MIERETEIFDGRQHSKKISPLHEVRLLPQPQQEKILADAVIQLTKLAARTPNTSAMSPGKKVEAATLAEEGLDDEIVAARFHVSRSIVRDARRDLRAVLVFLHPTLLESGFALTKEETARLSRLHVLKEESDRVKSILANPRVIEVLQPLPHVRRVLEVFSIYSTITPLLEELKIPYRDGEVWVTNRMIRDFLFTNKPLMGIRRLSTRIAMAKWLQTGSSWYGDDMNQLVAKAAQYLFTHSPNNNYTLIESIRNFLEEMFFQEFEREMRNKSFYDSPDFDKLFPSKTGVKAGSFKDVAIPDTFGIFASLGTYPSSMKKFIRRIIDGEDSTGIAREFGKGVRYSLQTKRSIAWAGLTFFENLVLSENGKRNNLFDVLTTQRLKSLKSARSIISEVDRQETK